MTNKELSQLHYLDKEVHAIQLFIEKMESRAESTTQTLTGMPRGNSASDKVGSCAIQLGILRSKAECLKRRAEAEEIRLMDYIMLIDDSLIRQIAILRFGCCLEWEEVAQQIHPEMSGETARNIWNRYNSAEK